MPSSGQDGAEVIVPAKLPMILKQFCKAAIRTQPYDLLKWSGAYFRALADGEEPPAKSRLEYPPPSTSSGLTFGFLRVLLRQFGDYSKTLSVETIFRRWDCLCLDRKDFNLIMLIGKFRRKCQVKKFLAIAAGLLGSSLFETMIIICELFTHEPDGGSAMIPASLFMEIYGYLAGLRCDGSERDSSDVEPTEFIVWDELDDAAPLKVRDTRENDEVSTSRTISSQDTAADTNVESEFTSKNDVETSRIELSSETSEGGREWSIEQSDRENSSSQTLRLQKSNEPSTGQSDASKSLDDDGQSDPAKSTDVNGPNDTQKSNTEDNTTSQNSGKELKEAIFDRGKKKRVKDSKLLTHYPDIPGIGPRVLAEEVATVAVWISECARCQGGMIGPRNLRHFQCPPLNPRQSLTSR